MPGKIVYSCPFVPAEWIEVHGFQPSRVSPDRYQKTAYHEACAYASAFADLVESIDADACILTTMCDQMRRMYDTIPQSADKPVFLMNVPHTWETANSRRMYLDEVLRLGRFLERIGGDHPTDEYLTDVMRRYDTARTSLRGRRGSVSSRLYSEMIRSFNSDPSIGCISAECGKTFSGDINYPSNAECSPQRTYRSMGSEVHSLQYPSIQSACGQITQGKRIESMKKFDPKIPFAPESMPVSISEVAFKPDRVPVALIGSPLMMAHMGIFDLVERHGGYIALDATETGERGIPAPFDRRRLAEEPLQVLADTYFTSISDAARRPNSLIYQWLSREIESRGIRALIFVRYVWCDIWHAESQRIKDWFKLPMLDLDITGESNDLSRNTTRIQAFMEMLK